MKEIPPRALAAVDFRRRRTTRWCCAGFAGHDAGEATMKYSDEARLDTAVVHEEVLEAGEPNHAVAGPGVPLAGARPVARSTGHRARPDYSEEAIPERDPAYRLPDATLYATQTAAYLPASERLALARCLEQLGINRARATILASV
jgi:hypothetical protein